MRQLELLFGSLIIIIGISHIILAKDWALLFKDLQNKSYAAPAIGLFTIISGLPIVLFHNIWVLNLQVITTLLGWAWTLKSIKYMFIPNSYNYSYDEKKSPKSFIFVGIGMSVLGILMVVGYFIS